MSKSLTATAMLIITIAATTEARAQDNNRIGVLMGVPAMVGLDWEVSERIGLRSDFSFSSSRSSFESSEATASSLHTRAVGAGLSAVFYVRRWDALRLYVAPRFSHTLTRLTGGGGGSTTTASSGSGSLGGQCALGPRFSVFAEVGGAYTHSRTSSPGPFSSVNSSSAVGNRSAVGAILFF